MGKVYLQVDAEEIEVISDDYSLPQTEKLVGLDIETTGLCPYTSKIRLVQLYFPTLSKVYVLDLFKASLHEVGVVECFLRNHNTVAHNALFELTFLRRFYNLPTINIGCSQMMYSLVEMAAKAVGKEFKASLEAASFNRLGYKVDKSLQKSDWSGELSSEQIKYAALDAVLCRKLVDACREDFLRYGLKDIYLLNKAAMKPVVDMHLNGVYINPDRHDKYIEQWSKASIEAYKELRKIIPPSVNINSSKQMTEYLTEVLPAATLRKWPVSPKSGYLKTDKETYSQHTNLPFVQHMQVYNKYSKYISTYGQKLRSFVCPSTKRIHAFYTLCSTRTGRMSSFSPNMQNQPKGEGMREVYEGQGDNVLVVADYSQMELRVAALISNDQNMLEVFVNKKDYYAIVAAQILEVPEEQVSKDSEERKLAKALVLGLQYGMGVKKLVKSIKSDYGIELGYSRGKELVDKYYQFCSGLKRWRDNKAVECENTLISTTLGGKIRRLSTKNFYTTGINTPIQGTSAEIMLLALVKVSQRLEGTDIKLIFCVHDEVGLECSEKDVDKAKEILDNCMKEAMLDVFPEAQEMADSLVDVNVGKTWGDCK